MRSKYDRSRVRLVFLTNPSLQLRQQLGKGTELIPGPEHAVERDGPAVRFEPVIAELDCCQELAVYFELLM